MEKTPRVFCRKLIDANLTILYIDDNFTKNKIKSDPRPSFYIGGEGMKKIAHATVPLFKVLSLVDYPIKLK
jgi:hypothetical protein